MGITRRASGATNTSVVGENTPSDQKKNPNILRKLSSVRAMSLPNLTPHSIKSHLSPTSGNFFSSKNIEKGDISLPYNVRIIQYDYNDCNQALGELNELAINISQNFSSTLKKVEFFREEVQKELIKTTDASEKEALNSTLETINRKYELFDDAAKEFTSKFEYLKYFHKTLISEKRVDNYNEFYQKSFYFIRQNEYLSKPWL